MTHQVIKLEAIADTREEAIAWAMKALAGLLECGGQDFTTGGMSGNGSVKIEEIER